jgi:hypothetical protein
MATKKNIIVGAARVALGPSLDPVNQPALVAALKAGSGVRQWDWFGFSAQGVSTRATLPLTSSSAGAGGWRDVGYTQDGLETANDPSWSDVEVDQLLDAAKIFKDGMSFTVSTTLAEATLENLLIAWGQSNSFYSGTFGGSETEREVELDGGSLGAAPLERGLVAVGNGPEKADGTYGERAYFVYRVLSVDAASTSMARSEAATVPVSFRALPADNGKYGSVKDRLTV